jgi:hypothetical protein
MPNNDLKDDMIKLVRYTIVSTAPDCEKVLYSGEVLVTENISDEAFAAWMISAYFEKPEHEKVRHSTKKSLRVSYNVLERWSSEPHRFKKETRKALKQIRHATKAKLEVLNQIHDATALEPASVFNQSRFDSSEFM